MGNAIIKPMKIRREFRQTYWILRCFPSLGHNQISSCFCLQPLGNALEFLLCKAALFQLFYKQKHSIIIDIYFGVHFFLSFSHSPKLTANARSTFFCSFGESVPIFSISLILSMVRICSARTIEPGRSLSQERIGT